MFKAFSLIAVSLLLIAAATLIIFERKFQKKLLLLILPAIFLLTAVEAAELKGNVLMKKGVIYTGTGSGWTVKAALLPAIDADGSVDGTLYLRTDAPSLMSEGNAEMIISLENKYGVGKVAFVMKSDVSTANGTDIVIPIELTYNNGDPEMKNALLTLNGTSFTLKEQPWLKTLFTEENRAYAYSAGNSSLQ